MATGNASEAYGPNPEERHFMDLKSGHRAKSERDKRTVSPGCGGSVSAIAKLKASLSKTLSRRFELRAAEIGNASPKRWRQLALFRSDFE